MLRPRLIPALLIERNRLVKTINFKNPRYIGDPINAIRLFNEKLVDEIAVLDISNDINQSSPNYDLIRKMANEAQMPFSYGGGIDTIEKAEKIISFGVEKIIIGTELIKSTNLVKEISNSIGSQSCVAMINIKKFGKFRKKYSVVAPKTLNDTGLAPLSLAKLAEEAGAGEIIFNNVDLDGKMEGYDLDFATAAKLNSQVPVTILGGAGSLNDIKEAVSKLGIIGCAAGSVFVYKGKLNAVLINYPSALKKAEIFS